MTEHRKDIQLSCNDPKWQRAATTNFPSPMADRYEPLSNAEKITRIAAHFQDIMKILGLDLEDESLAKTPSRIAKMYVEEIFSGLAIENFPQVSLLEEPTANEKNGELILTKASFTSFCEHHFVPMLGVAYVAYIPQGKIVGLSKVPRVVRYFASRPQLQERLTAQIADSLSILLETEHVAISIHAQHFCVISRGIRDESSSTTTSYLKGDFQNIADRKLEFFAAIERMMHQRSFIE